MSNEVSNLFAAALTSALVWLYYRRRIYPASEKYSTFGPRFWTASVDALVLWPLTFLISLALARDLPSPLRTTMLFLQETAWLAYSVILHTRFGQTCGKMVCRVKVVDFKTERPLSFRQALLREGIPIFVSLAAVVYQAFDAVEKEPLELVKSGTFWVLTMMPAFWFLAEVITMLTNDKRRALHDFIAGTVVIRTNVAQS